MAINLRDPAEQKKWGDRFVLYSIGALLFIGLFVFIECSSGVGESFGCGPFLEGPIGGITLFVMTLLSVFGVIVGIWSIINTIQRKEKAWMVVGILCALFLIIDFAIPILIFFIFYYLVNYRRTLSNYQAPISSSSPLVRSTSSSVSTGPSLAKKSGLLSIIAGLLVSTVFNVVAFFLLNFFVFVLLFGSPLGLLPEHLLVWVEYVPVIVLLALALLVFWFLKRTHRTFASAYLGGTIVLAFLYYWAQWRGLV